MKKMTHLMLSFVISFTLVPWTGFAVDTAPVRGTVTDSEGNPIANAIVLATDDQGNATANATTNGQGQYSMMLPVGKKYTYQLDPPAPFKKPTEGVARPLLAVSGAVVNLTLDDTGGKALVGLGALTIAGSVGAAVGTASEDKKVGSPSN